MEGVTGMMARLGHVPGCSRGGLYGPANIDFRFVMQLRLQRAVSTFVRSVVATSHVSPRDPTLPPRVATFSGGMAAWP